MFTYVKGKKHLKIRRLCGTLESMARKKASESHQSRSTTHAVWRYRQGTVINGVNVSGRFAPKGRGKSKVKEVQTVLRKVSGRISHVLHATTEKTIRRTATVSERGKDAGRIDIALEKTNFMSSRSLKGAKRIELTITGKSLRTIRPIKISLNLGAGIKKVPGARAMVVQKIRQALSDRGYRTFYTLDIVNWKKAQSKKSDVKKRKPLKGVTIVAKITK